MGAGKTLLLNSGVIVIPAFKRAKSLSRLLQSIERSFLHSEVPIIISFDGGFAESALDVASNFTNRSRFSDVTIKTKKENIGLKEHILECASIVIDYDFLVLLEDDLFVAEDFFDYAYAAANYFNEDRAIAGSALYSPAVNELSGLPFTCLGNGDDNYFMQIPCSWGQVWTTTQWQEFHSWYLNNINHDLESIDTLPERVAKWPESSWKKYFYAYCVSQEKFFTYPYLSRTSNFADIGGEHMRYGTKKFQVNIAIANKNRTYKFKKFTDSAFCYDGFMEIKPEILGLSGDVCVDLHGLKPNKLKQTYASVLSSVPEGEIICSYGLEMRPVELNVLYKIDGVGVYLSKPKKTTSTHLSGDYILHLVGFDPLRPSLFVPLFRSAIVKLKHKITARIRTR